VGGAIICARAGALVGVGPTLATAKALDGGLGKAEQIKVGEKSKVGLPGYCSGRFAVCAMNNI
jgi:hypothetical protein